MQQLLERLKKIKKKNIIIICVAVVVVLAVVFSTVKGKNNAAGLDLSDTTVLKYGDIKESISATGVVESAHSTKVYSTLTSSVKDVLVEVGDYVEEGQLMAELDDESIQNSISSQQASMNASSRSSSEQIKAAQSNYDNYKEGLDEGLNSSLISAQSQVDSAYDAYEKAVRTYERYKESIDNNENTSSISARESLRQAEKAKTAAQEAYDATKSSYQSAYSTYTSTLSSLTEAKTSLTTLKGKQTTLQQEIAALGTDKETEKEKKNRELSEVSAEITTLEAQIATLESSLKEAETAMNAAKTKQDSAKSSLDDAVASYNTAYASYRATMTTVDNTLEDYKISVDQAWDSYQTALTSLEATQKATQDQLESYENNLSSAKTNADTSVSRETIRQLEVQLEDTKITAPTSGTVTAVYATVGSTGSGLLFVIEDTEDLIVDTSIQEYDIGKVKVGAGVDITADALSDDVKINGSVKKIAPTAAKNSKGDTDTTTDAVYETEVTVTSKDTGLKIGMSVDLDYVVSEETHILAVPYDAVYKNSQNEKCVIAAVEQSDGRYLLTQMKVTTGMDDELDIVISGDGIGEGLRILNEPDDYVALIGQTVQAK